MTKEQALALASARLRLQEQAGQRQSKSELIQQEALDPITQQALNPAGQMSGSQRFLAGAGRGIDQVMTGARQAIPPAPTTQAMLSSGFNPQQVQNIADAARITPQQVEEQRDRDVSLMASPEGFLGNIVGGGATTAPAIAVPGANTTVGAGLLSALYGFLQPVGEGESRAVNTGVGGVAGVGTKLGMDKVLVPAVNKAVNAVKGTATRKAQNAIRDATLKEAQEAGYALPPSAVKRSFLGNRLESIGGKAAVGQEAAYRNQQVTNNLARKALGLSDDVPLSTTTLEELRRQAGQAYREVASLSPRAAAALEELKTARFDANNYWQHYNRSADPNSLKLARELGSKVEELERTIEEAARGANRPELVKALRSARAYIAKTYEVEKAINVATGDVSAPVLGRAIDKGRPLTGELATIGKFQQAFPSYAREGASIPTPGVSKSEAISSAILGTVGYGAGGPAGILAGSLPLLSGPVRHGILSGPAQRLMVKPSYSVPMTSRALAAAGRSKYLPRLGPALPPASALIGVGNFPEE